MSETEQISWPDLRPGDRIVERQHNSTIKTVESVAVGSHVMARGMNLRRIAWRNLNRYRILPRERTS